MKSSASHTIGADQIALGEDVLSVSKQMGYASSTITLSVYADEIDSARRGDDL